MCLLLQACSSGEVPVVQLPTTDVRVIPKPISVKRFEGSFTISGETKLVASDDSAKRAAALLNDELTLSHQIALQGAESPDAAGSIVLKIRPSEKADTDESYDLKVSSERIELVGTEKGLFHAVQTLLQLIEPDRQQSAEVPVVEISDSPRFKYRGMHLDSARHFMPVEFVKKYIRLIARYKFNYFHWHLTDDQGWRVEIRKYPALTERGSKRRETAVGKNFQPRPYVGDGVEHEGFYSQDQIRDIIAYAAAHGVTIIPEIDVPGHTSAALAAHPEFGCKPKSGYKVQTMWGGFADILCPTDATIEFVTNVLTEINELFQNPPYIHIGGDEVDLSHWKDSAYVQELKRGKNLASENEVKGWFMQRISENARALGVRTIIWDDMLGSGIDRDSPIMVWQEAERASAALSSGHEVIMAPWKSVYFDHPQSDSGTEPLSLGAPVTLDNAYLFDPIPSGADESGFANVIGGQGCIWTEFIKTTDHVEYMMFPRTIALAEALWTRRSSKNIGDFKMRLAREFLRLESEKLNYRLPEPYGMQDRTFAPTEKAIINLSSPISNGKIYYTENGEPPTRASIPYRGPFVLKDLSPGTSVTIKAIVVSSSDRQSAVGTCTYTRLSDPRPAPVQRRPSIPPTSPTRPLR